MVAKTNYIFIFPEKNGQGKDKKHSQTPFCASL